MSTAVLSIGSNLGDRLGNLQSVLDGLGQRVRAVSPVYATAPWGGVEQQDFLNAVLVVDDPRVDCQGWLSLGHELEQAAERVRDVRWGPRTLDVDIVVCDDVRSDDPNLTLPHPRAHERAFVLVPWLAVQPDAMLPRAGVPVPVRVLLGELDPAESAGVRRTEGVLIRRGAV